jgi:hypothetical protein
MRKSGSLHNQVIARAAAAEAAPAGGVGDFIESVSEGEGVTTYLFEAKLKGYLGWRWSVTLFEGDDSAEPTISELVLLPGAESLVAPDWIPWSERLADYKALQAELEAQALLDAAEADEDADDEVEDEDDLDEESRGDDLDEDSDEQIEEVLFDIANEESDDVQFSEEPSDSAEDLASANLDESEPAEGDSETTGRKPPRFFGRRKRGIKGATRNKGKNPKD